MDLDFFTKCEFDSESLARELALPGARIVNQAANPDRFIAIRSLVWFGDADPEPDPVSLKNRAWQAVKRSISQAVANLAK